MVVILIIKGALRFGETAYKFLSFSPKGSLDGDSKGNKFLIGTDQLMLGVICSSCFLNVSSRVVMTLLGALKILLIFIEFR